MGLHRMWYCPTNNILTQLSKWNLNLSLFSPNVHIDVCFSSKGLGKTEQCQENNSTYCHYLYILIQFQAADS